MTRDLGRATNLKVHPKDEGQGLSIRLELSGSSPVSFEISSVGAMHLMQTLQHFQRVHHWPIPMTRYSSTPTPRKK